MQTGTKTNNNRGSNIAGIIRSRYVPYWPLFLVLLTFFLTAAWLYLQYTLPQYRASATILIKDEGKGVDDSKMIESLQLISTKKTVENEIEVIRSRALMIKVVNKLNLYTTVFEQDKWRDKSAYATSPVKIEVQLPDSQFKTGKAFFTYNPATEEVIMSNQKYKLNSWVSTSLGKIRFMSTGIYADPRQVFYFTTVEPKSVMFDLIKRISVSPANKLSTVINISITDEVPSRAENILDELIVAYHNAAISDKDSLAANTLSFLQDRLALVSQELNTIEKRIEQYKSGRGAVDIGSQGKLFLETVNQNDRKASDIDMQLAVLDKVERIMQSKDNVDGVVPSALGISDPGLTQLLNKHYELVLENAKLKKVVGLNSPMLIAITDQIEQIKRGILANIQSQRGSLVAIKKNLMSANNNYEGLLQSIPQKERQLVNISRQQNIQGNIYTFLLQKREEVALSYSSIVTDNTIVDKAQSSLLPVSPNKWMAYGLSFILALLSGIGLIAGRDLITNKILYRREIESLTELPVIGEIGLEKSNKAIVIAEENKSLVAAQFRKLRGAVCFSSHFPRPKKILITSSIPGEGKSFIALNLGISLALAGKKVVVLELDTTNPFLSKALNMTANKGWAEYVTNNASSAEIIKRTPVNNNLFVIPAGEMPVNSADLIVNDKIASLITGLEAEFDYILLDAAPVTRQSDAYVLSPLCDTTLYIIRHGLTPKVVIERLDKTNKTNHLNNMVVVFNGVPSIGFSKGTYTFGYDQVYN